MAPEYKVAKFPNLYFTGRSQNLTTRLEQKPEPSKMELPNRLQLIQAIGTDLPLLLYYFLQNHKKLF
jgi:hypothetical protein